MKKKLLFLSAIATMLFATSCSQEDDFAPVADGTEVAVSFTAQLPQEIATRAYSDGLTAQQLVYAFYDAADESDVKTPLLKGTANFNGGLTATVNVNLATGKTYNILFWAQKEGNKNYSVDWAAQTLTVNYKAEGANAAANNENNDAFFHFEKGLYVTGAINKEIKLYRPFAQINLGTSDYVAAKAAGLTVSHSAMKAVELPTVMSFVDGSVDQYETIEFTKAAIPAVTFNAEGTAITDRAEAFPVAGYEYLEMNYVLVDSTKSTINCEFYIYETDKEKYLEPTIVVSNVPVQRNYRTNIYGALLTDPAQFNVTIEPAYKEPDYEVSVWDGVAATEPTQDAEGNYTIETAAELAWVAEQTIDGNTFEGKTVTLMSDLDLNNKAWTPIGGNVTSHPSQTFAGVFNGNGKTISNLNAVDNSANWASAGLFGTITGEVKNVTVKDATVKSSHYAGAIVGYITDGVSITNCHVDNATITSVAELLADGSYDNGDKVGGIVGYANSVNIDGCTVKNATLQGYRDLGGIAGLLSDGTATNNTIENVTINVVSEHNYKGYTTNDEYDANAIVGEGTADSSNKGEATINYLHKAVATVAELVKAATEGGTITLTENLEITESINVPEGVHLTINANGRTISYNDPDATGSESMFIVKGENTVLTINADENTLFEAAPRQMLLWARGSGTIIVNGGTFIGSDYDWNGSTDDRHDLVYANGHGAIIINGGYFKTNKDCYVLNIRNVDSGNATITTYGGTFVNFNPAMGDDNDGHWGPFVPAGYKSEQTGTTEDGLPIYTVTKE